MKPGRHQFPSTSIALRIAVIATVALLAMPCVVPQSFGADDDAESQRAPVRSDPAEERMKDFVSVVLADTEDTWGAIFAAGNARYEAPKLVLFTDAVRSACGNAQSAMGPFYCPGDHKVYIDLSFYRDLTEKLGAPGDFAQAYVIAHEVGHHVQNLLGQLEHGNDEGANRGSVRTELQAHNLPTFVSAWASALLRNAANNAHTTLLVHPSFGVGLGPENLAAKLVAVDRLLAVARAAGLRTDVSVTALAEFWRARREVQVDASFVSATGYRGSITVGDRAVTGFTLEFGDVIGRFECAGCGPTRIGGRRVALTGTLAAGRRVEFTALPR